MGKFNKKTTVILDQVKNGNSAQPAVGADTESAPKKAKKINFSLGLLKKTQSKKSASTKGSKLKKILFIIAVIILIPSVLIGVIGLATYFPVKNLQTKIKEAETVGREAYDALKGQDLILANQKLDESKAKLDEIKTEFNKLSWYKFTPFRAYYFDGERVITSAEAGVNAGTILLDTIEPYADVLGFSGEGSFVGGTAEERIVKIVETLDKVTPALDDVASQLQIIQTNLNQINPERYPVEVRGRSVAAWIELAQTWTDRAVVAVTDVKPLLEVLPSVAGVDGERKYLVMFQNDAEIRPTGGFMTAYGVLRVEKGKVYQENSDDIYSLDEKFNSRLQPPEPITKYLDNVFYWYLRDMNLSPDFKISMDTFMEHYRTVPNEPADQLDGIIAVDTQVLTDLIRVLGPTDVPGFGTFTAEIDPRCDCPQVIYELEDYATRPRAYIRTDRKAFLAPMLQTLLLKAYGSPKNVWPQLFEVVINNVIQKHVLFTMFDEEVQAAAEQVNIAGRINEYDGDYFHINDTNFGGAKSNLFITEELEHEITLKDGQVERSVEVTYKNPAPASNCNLEAGQLCLNGVYRNWVRFYLPLGAEITETLGFEEGSVKTSQDLGKTVVEGFFKFPPESQSKIKISYTIPYAPENEYKLLIQKQPGKKAPKYRVTFDNVERQEFELLTDKEVVFEM